jgi:hypothetical protein
MTELDRFEGRFAAAYRRYLDEAPTDVDGGAMARSVAEAARAGTSTRSWPWALRLTPALAWVVVLALLLAAFGAAALFVSSQRTVLGFTCPAGTDPDAAGPAAQARPDSLPWRSNAYGWGPPPSAFDRDSGKIVLLDNDVDGGPETWSFDVCTNTWTRMQAAGEPGSPPRSILSLAYDAESDLMVGVLSGWGADEGTTWVYDLDANHWQKKVASPLPGGGFGSRPYALVYDPVEDLVVAVVGWDDNEPLILWAYDVDVDEWTLVEQSTPPQDSGVDLLGFDASVDRLVAVGFRATWLFDHRTGSWAEARGWYPEDLNVGAYPGGVSSEQITYDESTDRTTAVFNGRVVAWDAPAARWEALYDGRDPGELDAAGPTARQDHITVYDPVNERLVVFGGRYRASVADAVWVPADDVLAFDPATGRWITLVPASETLPPQ